MSELAEKYDRDRALALLSYGECYLTKEFANELADDIRSLLAEVSEKDLLIGRLVGVLEGIQTLSHGGDSQVYQAAGMGLDFAHTEQTAPRRLSEK